MSEHGPRRVILLTGGGQRHPVRLADLAAGQAPAIDSAPVVSLFPELAPRRPWWRRFWPWGGR